jgi:hypothetical protein
MTPQVETNKRGKDNNNFSSFYFKIWYEEKNKTQLNDNVKGLTLDTSTLN